MLYKEIMHQDKKTSADFEDFSLFAILLFLIIVAMVIFLIAAATTLFVTWLIGLVMPLPFWQILSLNSILLVAMAYVIGRLEIISKIEAAIWILATFVPVTVITAFVAWLLTLIAPLTLEQALVPSGALIVTVTIFLVNGMNELFIELQQQELLEESEAQLLRLRSDPPSASKPRKSRSKK